MAFKISTLSKCNKIAATMNPKRYMSETESGHKLLEIIRLLLPESGGQPGVVSRQLLAIARTYKWDVPRISADQEEKYLSWLVLMVAQGSPVAVVPPVPMETGSAKSGPTLPSSRRRR